MTTWSSIAKEANNYSQKFKKLTPGKHLIRPVGMIVSYYEIGLFLNGKWVRAICDESDAVYLTAIIASPKRKYAVNILDMLDKDNIKILTGTDYLFSEFAEFHKKTGKDPCKVDGGHWRINVEIDGKFKTEFAGPHILTDKQIENIKQKNLYDLKKEFSSENIEEIEKKFNVKKPIITNVNDNKIVVENSQLLGSKKTLDLDF